ncbi:MAG TPA: hypothetical protein DCR43_09870 [Bacteroidales bacterium]|nr:MAG: hypothetical protein CVU06_09510 [Bacteroidetes bacterium HGW-Bacteroidetes-22]HAQ66142.1 hypothetical protein [Bacteroidales bacterium]HBZ65226.1 hypothetical protein [Bacteroidales bacterium]
MIYKFLQHSIDQNKLFQADSINLAVLNKHYKAIFAKSIYTLCGIMEYRNQSTYDIRVPAFPEDDIFLYVKLIH